MRGDVVNTLRCRHNAKAGTVSAQRVGGAESAGCLAPCRAVVKIGTDARDCTCLGDGLGCIYHRLAGDGVILTTVGSGFGQLVTASRDAQLAQGHDEHRLKGD